MSPKAATRRRSPSPKKKPSPPKPKPSPPKPSPPKGGSPIKHVVIIVKENHAFDN